VPVWPDLTLRTGHEWGNTKPWLDNLKSSYQAIGLAGKGSNAIDHRADCGAVMMISYTRNVGP
jgi:hypothetical protein